MESKVPDGLVGCLVVGGFDPSSSSNHQLLGVLLFCGECVTPCVECVEEKMKFFSTFFFISLFYDGWFRLERRWEVVVWEFGFLSPSSSLGV